MSRILIAEDRPSSRELLRTVLEAYGYEIIEAENGREALERAFQEEIHLFLLDLQMPELNGFEVLMELRRSEKYRLAPIVAITASAMSGDRERALDAGFSGYIAKPVDLAALRAHIRRLLNQE